MKLSQIYRKGFINDPISTLTSVLRYLSLFSEFEYRVNIAGNWVYTVEKYQDNKLADSLSFPEFYYLRDHLLKEVIKLEILKIENNN